MNQPPLTRREHVATALLSGLLSSISNRDASIQEIDDFIGLALTVTDRLLAALDKTAPVSAPPAAGLPLCPPNIPKPPEGTVFVGRGPIQEQATGPDMADVYLLNARDRWVNGNEGSMPMVHYALRRGSPIAIANGITD